MDLFSEHNETVVTSAPKVCDPALDSHHVRIQQERPPSPVPSCLSMKTDWSMEDPYNFNKNTPSYAHPDDMACDLCTERKSCLTCSKSYCESHVKQHYTVPALQRQLVEPPGGLEDGDYQQDLVCSKAVDNWLTKCLPPPIEVKSSSVTFDSVTVSWVIPDELAGQRRCFKVIWSDGKDQSSLKVEDMTKIQIKDLSPGVKYQFKVDTVREEYSQNDNQSCSVRTEIPAPAEITAEPVDVTSFTVSWTRPQGMDKHPLRYLISCSSPGTEAICTTSQNWTFSDLLPATEYTVCVSTVLKNGEKSKSVYKTLCTKPISPVTLNICYVGPSSVTLTWEKPSPVKDVPHSYRVIWRDSNSTVQSITTDENHTVVSNLTPATEYSFSLCTVLSGTNISSETVCTTVRTKISLEDFTYSLGLQNHLRKKLTLSDVLKVDDEVKLDTQESLCWCFLKKLMAGNMMARSVRVAAQQKAAPQHWLTSMEESMQSDSNDSNAVNPLDLVTALFLCSDGLLQQELALKMSLCQFSVPLLLPNCDTQQCTLMLWALRGIVKRFRPHSLQESRGYVENSIVNLELPMVSFVRLGRSSLSKSHILNHILSSPQDYHDIFFHHNMKNGNIPRKVSDGLVEISWYLPSGNKNTDIFPEPVAVANLRGDISSFETQFSFLCQTSAAVFVFCDELGQNKNLLKPHDTKAKIFLICNSQSPNFSKDDFKKRINDIQFDPDFVLLKNNCMNSDEFVKKLRLYVDKITKSNSVNMNIEDMSSFGHQCGILVDEDCDHCLKAKQNADALTKAITDVSQFKEEQLPLHTKNQKMQATLADKNGYIITPFMTQFISALSVSREERAYFLRWMKVLLDNLSRKHLSELLKKYKLLNASWMENKENRAHVHKEISRSSLGIEHFLRETGYLYELAGSSPECSAPMQKIKQFKQLPLLYAEMMLDGFPLELVDGDGINISQKWVSEVMNALHPVLRSSSKLRVITVLGVENSGKSTLLNTMFGVQIAVSGTSSRGAFMFLLRLNESFRQHLECDFIVVINTKCLRSSELVQPHDSYEEVYKIATVVARLSDITVINTAMENVTELKDILQGVIHAFLYMKTVGQKPSCLFVQHNVADVSAYEKNLIHRKVLLEQLNMMTEKAAKVKNVSVKSFTDIVEYDTEQNNWYIPGIWHGLPAMASVSVGYSEAVTEIKKKITDILKEKTTAHVEATTVEQFLKSTNTLWNAVKDGSV